VNLDKQSVVQLHLRVYLAWTLDITLIDQALLATLGIKLKFWREGEKHYSAWVKARQESLDEAVEKANGYHGLPKDDEVAPAPNVVQIRRRGARSR
jgi:hypothetical protein